MKSQKIYNILGTLHFRRYLEAQTSYTLALNGGKTSEIQNEIFTSYLVSNENLLSSGQIRKEIISIPLYSN